LRVVSLRWPLVEVVVFTCLVQGSDAPQQIADAIHTACRYSQEVEMLHTLIVARGGGSIEDLWAFNDERVAYAIAGSVLPIVTGIGHETDFTIADFVADLRAPTPSAAAAAVVPDVAEIRARFQHNLEWMAQEMFDRIETERREIAQLRQRLSRLHPSRQIDLQRQRLDDRERRLRHAMSLRLVRLKERGTAGHLRLNALNPHNVLRRGYSIVQQNDDNVVTSPESVTIGEALRVRAAGGEYRVMRTG
jgi:exodeoxyribonuclease VII large subunit